MELLFMLEILVDKIIFASKPLPQKKQLVIQATCGNLVQLEIRTDVMGALETQERDSKRMDIDVNCGRSHVFSINPTALKQTIAKFPIEIFVSTKLQTEPLGKITIPWHAAFTEMIDSSELGDYTSPVYSSDYYQITNNDKANGGAQVYVRLTPLGKNIDTHIQIIDIKPADGAPGGPGKQFLFKDANNATAFQCQKYGLGSDGDIVPIAPIFAASDRLAGAPPTLGALNTLGAGGNEMLSLYNTTMSSCSLASVAPSVFGLGMMMMGMPGMGAYGGLSSASIQSTMSELIKAKAVGKTFDLRELHDELFMSFLNHLEEDGEAIDYKTLTKEQIERMLCKNPDCPAAKKFKDFGIGPLAKGNGLGGLYKDVEPPITYGLSHCNGRIDKYGPLATYSRPKRPEEPFIPKRDRSYSGSSSSRSSMSSGNSSCFDDCETPHGLNGGSEEETYKPLRLKGGSPISIPENDSMPNPQHECKDLMDEYNKLLNEYKNALGPCGQATCPFAHNVVAEVCKKMCKFNESEPNPVCPNNPAEVMVEQILDDDNKPNDISGCGIARCPFSRDIITPADRDHKRNQSKPACGSTTCPFVREKLGLEEVDDIYMPAQPCSGKKCPYRSPVELPPIHWDCPDPLPKGECTNPNCPFVTQEKILKKYFPPPSSPCGSPTCPYTSMPCTYPGCPFQAIEACPPTCPYLEPVPTELQCTPSICPFAVKADEQDICDNPECPYMKKQNSDCPYKQKQKKREPVQCCSEPLPSCVQIKLPCLPEPPCKQPPSCMKPPCMEPPPCQLSPLPPCLKQESKKKRNRPSCCQRDAYSDSVIPEESVSNRTNSCMDDPNSDCVYKKKNKKMKDKVLRKGRTTSICMDSCVYKQLRNADNRSYDKWSGDGGRKPCDDSCDINSMSTQSDESLSRDICEYKTCNIYGGSLECNECFENKSSSYRKGDGDRKSQENKSLSISQGSNNKKNSKLNARGNSKTDKMGKPGKNKKQVLQAIVPERKLSKKNKKGRKGKKRRTGYVYDQGTYYPGNKIGHRECIVPKFNVPADMGWLWNVHTKCMQLRPRRGWKPGAIGRTISARIDEHRRKYGLDPISKPPGERKIRRRGPGGTFIDDSDVENIPVKPTLQVKKKDGIVYVTMNPLKDPKELEDNENPYMECSPMQFKIMKNKPLQPKPKKKAFKMCYCGETGEQELQEVELSSSSSSELDIEFTPPAGIIRPERFRKKKNICHIDTQYSIEDCGIVPKMISKPGKAKPKGKGGKKK